MQNKPFFNLRGSQKGGVRHLGKIPKKIPFFSESPPKDHKMSSLHHPLQQPFTVSNLISSNRLLLDNIALYLAVPGSAQCPAKVFSKKKSLFALSQPLNACATLIYRLLCSRAITSGLKLFQDKRSSTQLGGSAKKRYFLGIFPKWRTFLCKVYLLQKIV